jgi:hypothetical protein
MMKKNAYNFCLILISSLLVISCNKPGTGGDVSLAVWVKHHNELIPGAIVYIKYGAREFPGTDVSKYDDKAVCGTEGHGLGHTHFKNLRKGRYYLYSVGWDHAINMEVTGGIPVVIDQKAGELMVTVPVTEEH